MDTNNKLDYFWEDHHGSEIYKKRLLLLLLFRFLDKLDIEDVPIDNKIFNVNLSCLTTTKLKNITYEIKDLILIAQKLFEDHELIEEFNFRNSQQSLNTKLRILACGYSRV